MDDSEFIPVNSGKMSIPREQPNQNELIEIADSVLKSYKTKSACV